MTEYDNGGIDSQWRSEPATMGFSPHPLIGRIQHGDCSPLSARSANTRVSQAIILLNPDYHALPPPPRALIIALFRTQVLGSYLYIVLGLLIEGLASFMLN